MSLDEPVKKKEVIEVSKLFWLTRENANYDHVTVTCYSKSSTCVTLE